MSPKWLDDPRPTGVWWVGEPSVQDALCGGSQGMVFVSEDGVLELV